MQRYLAAGIWLVLTIAATSIVWEAVSLVAADVTDRPAPVVASHDVAAALHAAGSTTTVAATTPPPPPPTTAPTQTTRPPTAAPTTLSNTVARPPATTLPTFTPSPTTVPVHATTVPATTPPTAPPTTSGATATYSTPGGVALVACTGPASIRLVAALAADGYQAVVVSGGPNFVALSFIGQGKNYPVGAACAFGQPYQFKNNQTFP